MRQGDISAGVNSISIPNRKEHINRKAYALVFYDCAEVLGYFQHRPFDHVKTLTEKHTANAAKYVTFFLYIRYR